MKREMAPVVAVVLAVTVTICLSQCHVLATTILSDLQLDFWLPHAKPRALVRVAPLNWSERLEHDARTIARSMASNHRSCHSLDPGSIKDLGGHNLYWDPYGEPSPRDVVDKWVEMKKFYNYDKNYCARGKNCSSYTQVVWRNSLELGCSQEICLNKPQGEQVNGITLCLYSPPGNVPGERPY